MIIGFLILLFGWIGTGHCQNMQTNAPRLIIRTDDIGLCHGVNMAFKRIAEQGMVSSASVIVNTPWLDEAVEIEAVSGNQRGHSSESEFGMEGI
jgi:hypothetical protein